MTTSSSAWRSPLSILMGARRNDDADLELRDDNFHPHSPPTAAESGRAQKSGLASYLPFGYFGATASPANDANGLQSGGATQGNRISSNGSPAAPPRGAFPPPLPESSGRNDSAGDNFLDGRVEHHDPLQMYHQSVQAEPDRENDSSNQPNEHDRPIYTEQRSNGYMAWPEQKAIIGTTFNFTNSVIGAGAMGLGGAFAASGGGISVLCLLGFAYLTKQSLDLIVDLSSCPDVMRKARANVRVYVDRNDEEEEVEIQFSEDESKESLTRELLTPKIDLSPPKEGQRDDVAADVNGAEKEPDSLEKRLRSLLHEEDAGEEWKQIKETVDLDQASKGERKDPSPLMAPDAQVEITDTNPNLDHPLAPSHSATDGTRRYDSLISTQPPLFLPLDINGDIPTSKTMPAVQNNDGDDHDGDNQQSIDMTMPCTYEELGHAAFGSIGRLSVLLSKALYSFGCLIAYIIVVRDNFGPAIRRLTSGSPSLNFVDYDNFDAIFFQWESNNEVDCDGLGDVTMIDTDRCQHNVTVGESNGSNWMQDDSFLAFWVSALVILPLSCPRTMEPLAKFSFVSILSILFLVLAIVYLYFTCIDPAGGETEEVSFYDNWIKIRSFTGFFESLGTFVFTFICQHTVNLAYESLPSPIRNPKVWRRVSTNSIALALETSLSIGVFAYLTFGSNTPADVLLGYPSDLVLANIARLLLCLTMVLTFPLPFLTCREMITMIMVDCHSFYYARDRSNWINSVSSCFSWFLVLRRKIWTRLYAVRQEQVHVQGQMETGAERPGEDIVEMQQPASVRRRYFGKWNWNLMGKNAENRPDEGWWDEINQDGRQLTQPLLNEERIVQNIGGEHGREVFPSPLSSPSSSESDDTSSSNASDQETNFSYNLVPPPSWILRPGNGRQLELEWHAALTFTIWFIVTIFAIKAPSLGDVLDFVGACTGTLLAFILPALFSFKLKGYSRMSAAILGIGGFVGFVGTVFSFVKFVEDVSSG